MASIFGDDGGTFVGGQRRPTNAGYGPPSGGAVPRGQGGGPGGGKAGPGPFGGPSGGFNPNAGNGDQPTGPSPLPTPAPAPAYNFGSVLGFGADKFNDPNKHDFKYDVGRTLSMFDPRKGFNTDVLAALNALGYGDFSGSGDRLSLAHAKNAQDAADFADQDWIYAYDANNDATKWMFGGGGADGGGTHGSPSGMPDFSNLFAPSSSPSAQMPDMSWLGDLLKSFTQPATPPPAPAPQTFTAPPLTVNVAAPRGSAPAPTFSGAQAGYGPGGGTVGDATQTMALRLAAMLQDPNAQQNPLVQQLMRLMGGN